MTCPSRTAWRVAQHRAKHQQAERGMIFHDPLAIRLLGDEADAVLACADAPGEQGFRQFMAVRSRIAEDKLALAVRHGVRQAVVLGAGLDTLGLRNPYAAEGLKMFEVDTPRMQVWKKRHIAEVGISVPDLLTFIPVDFEKESVKTGLVQAGFDLHRPAFFSWLGVTPYLTRKSIQNTLSFIASIPQAELVFDYGEPVENYQGLGRLFMEALERRVALLGEPWVSRFNAPEMATMLAEAGFRTVTDFDRARIFSYFGWPQKSGVGQASAHVIHAAV
ncbi:SAM-dependent methyltransferase [Acetobacter farinalis]|nr:SAM-dependent methyltransferase [Acetobacter farinalis]